VRERRGGKQVECGEVPNEELKSVLIGLAAPRDLAGMGSRGVSLPRLSSLVSRQDCHAPGPQA
jgi:hypothetical protein